MSAGALPEHAPPGYRPLAEAAKTAEIGYRQLWRRAQDGKIRAKTEDGEINAALQTKSGRWYLHPKAEIEREKKQITPELVSRVEQALKRGVPPRTIAYKEGISDTKVYELRDNYHKRLREEDREREEVLNRLRNPELPPQERAQLTERLKKFSELKSIHGGPSASYVIHFLDEKQERAYEGNLSELPVGRFYFDASGGLVLLVGEEHKPRLTGKESDE